MVLTWKVVNERLAWGTVGQNPPASAGGHGPDRWWGRPLRRGATKPVPQVLSPGTWSLSQRVEPLQPEACASQLEWCRSPQLEKAHAWQQRPQNSPKIRQKGHKRAGPASFLPTVHRQHMTTLYLTMFTALVYTHVQMNFPGQGSLAGYSARGRKSWTWLSPRNSDRQTGQDHKAPQPRTWASVSLAGSWATSPHLGLHGASPALSVTATCVPLGKLLGRLRLRLVTVSFLAGRAGASPRSPERPALTP